MAFRLKYIMCIFCGKLLFGPLLEASRARVDALRRKKSNQASTLSPEEPPTGYLLGICDDCSNLG